MKKRIIAGLLVLVLLFSAVPVSALAAQPEEQAAVDTGDVSIEGTNGFGTLLSQEITESQAETAEESEDYEAGYTVTDLVIEGTTATVTYDSMEEALLVVALYTEDGMRMLTSATATVTAEETEATVEFTGEMPEYFLASAYLVDTYDLSPLCAAYDTPMYTREMQELLASTVEDYDADRVMNLDDDNTTNFAVYAETTKVIEAAEGINLVASIDEENATYVIKNADEQITSLAVGNVFVYPYAENEILVVKVDTITIDGTTVTITGGKLEMEEAFAAVKIEGTDSTENMVVDDSTADDGVTYEGISDPTDNGALSPMNNEFGVEFSKSAKFKIDKDVVSKGDAKVNVAGSVEFSIKAELSYYVSATRQFVEFRIEKSVTGAITVTGKLEHEWKLCDAALYPVPGVGIGIKPTFKIEVSGEIEFNITLSGMIGFTYDAKQGLKPLFTAPNFDPDVKAECTIFVGFDLNPQVKIAEGYLAEFAIEVPIGLEFKITRTGNGGVEPTENDPVYHTCVRCLDLEAFFKVEVTVKLQFLKCKWLKIEGTPIKEKDGLGHAYFSFDKTEFGLGLCPYMAHRLTVIVTDRDDKPIPEADLKVAGNAVKTDDNGSAVFYLNAGNYSLEASSGDLTRSQRVQISQAQKVTVKLSGDTEDDAGIGGILRNIDSEILKDNTVSFDGHVYQLFNLALTWTEAKEYCEKLGGHLATINSQAEMDTVLNILDRAGKSYYWIGLYRDNPESNWKWVTNEAVFYTNWADGEPNNDSNAGENYAHLYSTNSRGEWNDESNSVHGYNLSDFGFVCEWSSKEDVVKWDSRYEIVYEQVSWTAAQAYCESMGGHLATITSAEEQMQLEALNTSNSQLWIGGYRDDAFNWYWVTGEAWEYTNWAAGEPNNQNNEKYVALWPNKWNDLADNSYEQKGFICEWDDTNSADAFIPGHMAFSNHDGARPNAVYPGDYGTEITDTYPLKTAFFTGLVPSEQYVLLAMKSIEVDDPLSADNLLFIDQAAALEDGTLSFQYVQRENTDISYVVACGASNKNLKDAEITFPEMLADGELQVVDPTVVYDGTILTEGRDYVIVGTVDFTEAGEYTCYIRGIHNYTGWVECTYTVTAENTIIASGTCGKNLTWTLTDTGVLTVSGTGDMEEFESGHTPWYDYRNQILTVVIEDGVTSVGSHAFYSCPNITSVTLSDDLISIGEYAFYYCQSLPGIEIPATVTTIGVSAFSLSGLKNVALPSAIETLGIRVFEFCVNLSSVDLQYSGTVTAEMFDGCRQLTDITFGMGITGIGESGFAGCSALESIVIPASITTVGDNAFAGCTALTAFTVEPENTVFCTVDGSLYSKDMTKLVAVPGGYAGLFEIPESVIRVGGGAFSGCTNLTGVTFHDGVQYLGSSVFRDCTSLTSIEIPEGITSIPFLGFCGCTGLEQISIPESIKQIKQSAFSGCTSLTVILFSGDAPSIGNGAFSSVTANAYYPRGNDTWTSNVMQDYGGTITWIASGKPETVATGWSGYTTWTLMSDGVLTFSGEGAMKNYTTKDGMPWYSYFDRITSVVLEEGVTSIGDYAFYGMPNLESITIPETVTAIGSYAFKNATKLDGVVLPSGLTKLGESAFYGCTSLTSIEIPASLWTVQPYTFKNCTALAEVTFHEGNLMKISDGAFYNTAVTELVLPDCLTILDVYSFKNCTKLESIILSGSLTQIREAVFYGTAIPTIEIPEGVTSIGPYAFKNCTRLVSIDLPSTLTSVGEASFYECTALKSLELPDAVTKIGNYAFRKCTGLTSVNFGSSLTNIGESSFYGCESLFYLDIPENVTTIQGYAFKGCTNLGIVELPNSLQTLGDSAFHTCTGLDEITIPGGVTKVGEYCFSGSTGIDYIYFLGDAPTIGSGAFNKIIATAYYPSGNSTWTSAVRQSYGGTITWKAN